MYDLECNYDAVDNILEIKLGGVRVESPEDLQELVAAVRSAWKRLCRGKKTYLLSDYNDYFVNLKRVPTEVYAEAFRTAMGEWALGFARFGGDITVRTNAWVATRAAHAPSAAYATREEAVEALRQMKLKKPR
jgi:hypothetical protein